MAGVSSPPVRTWPRPGMRTASDGNGYFLYASNLGAEYLQDSIFDPTLRQLHPCLRLSASPARLSAVMVLDLSDYGDGAANQYCVDEIRHAPFGDTAAPETIAPVFAAIDGYAMDAGNVGMSRAAYPTLEEPSHPSPIALCISPSASKASTTIPATTPVKTS